MQVHIGNWPEAYRRMDMEMLRNALYQLLRKE